MGAIPAQREPVARGADTCAPGAGGAPAAARVRATFPGSPLTPGGARALLRATLGEWAELALPGTEFLTDRQSDDAVVVVSELVTNAVVHMRHRGGAGLPAGDAQRWPRHRGPRPPPLALPARRRHRDALRHTGVRARTAARRRARRVLGDHVSDGRQDGVGTGAGRGKEAVDGIQAYAGEDGDLCGRGCSRLRGR